jgi:hypothetical protein
MSFVGDLRAVVRQRDFRRPYAMRLVSQAPTVPSRSRWPRWQVAADYIIALQLRHVPPLQRIPSQSAACAERSTPSWEAVAAGTPPPPNRLVQAASQ